MNGEQNLGGQLAFVLLVAIPLALVISLILRVIYLRAVKRSMIARSGAAPASAPIASASPPTTDLAFIDLGKPAKLEGAARALAARALNRRRQVEAVYAAGGLAFALIMAFAYLGETDTTFLPRRYLFLVLIYAWPVVLTVGLVAELTWRGWLAAIMIYFGALAALVASTLAYGMTWAGAALFWAGLAGLGAFGVAIFLLLAVRAIGLLILPLTLAAVAGSVPLATMLLSTFAAQRAAVRVGMAIGLDGEMTLHAIDVLGALALGTLGWLLLTLLARAYAHRRVSDQTILIDAVWLTYALMYATDMTLNKPIWLLAPLAAFAVYKIVTLIGFALIKPRAAQRPPRLLLLRVFSLGKRSETLFAALDKLWRHAGTIRLITGPDLATATIEPHEFLSFLSGRLSRHFISDAETLEQRLAETNDAPDPDGRYRVGDFFCHDDTWTMALARLVQESDVVLMDLRGFTPDNKGCAFEIDELLSVAPLERIVFVIDKTTHQDFLRETFSAGWAKSAAASPNRASAAPQARLFHLTGKGGGVINLVRHLAASLG